MLTGIASRSRECRQGGPEARRVSWPDPGVDAPGDDAGDHGADGHGGVRQAATHEGTPSWAWT